MKATKRALMKAAVAAPFFLSASSRAESSAGAAQSGLDTAGPYPVTAAEKAVSALPADLSFPPGDIRRYGADLTGAVASDTAFSRWLALHYAAASRTNPSGQARNRGLGLAKLPKGKIKLSRGYVAPSSAIGLIIRGEGQHATVIEFHSDSGALFKQTTYVNLVFEDLEFSHVAQNPDPRTWSNVCFELSGAGGGRKFQLNRVRTSGFHTIIKTLGQTNEDSFHVEHSEFYDYSGDFLYTRNSQAVINLFSSCTWRGRGESVFNYSGFGHTTVLNGNILLDGVWLRPFGDDNWSQSAVMRLINTKGEPRNYRAAPGGSPGGIVRPHGDASRFKMQIHLEDCGWTGGNELDPSFAALELSTGIAFRWAGGAMKNSGRIRISSAEGVVGRYQHVEFRELCECPSPATQLAFDPTGPGHFPSVTFKECATGPGGSGVRITNITMGHASGSRTPITLHEPVQKNQLGQMANAFNYLAIAGQPQFFDLPFYGSAQQIEEVSVELNAKQGGDLTIDLYLDPARARLVERIRFTSADNGDYPPARKGGEAQGSAEWEPAALPPGSELSIEVDLPGVLAGDRGAAVEVGFSGDLLGTELRGEVTADDRVTVHHANRTGRSAAVEGGTLYVRAMKRGTVVGRTATSGLYATVTAPVSHFGYIHATIKTR